MLKVCVIQGLHRLPNISIHRKTYETIKTDKEEEGRHCDLDLQTQHAVRVLSAVDNPTRV